MPLSYCPKMERICITVTKTSGVYNPHGWLTHRWSRFGSGHTYMHHLAMLAAIESPFRYKAPEEVES